MVEIWGGGGEGGKPLGRVVRAIDDSLGPSREIALKYEFPEKFPAPVMAECRAVPTDPRPADLAGRIDLRKQVVFTIDPEDAADFDDALSARGLPGGALEVGVHIADVSHYVRPAGRIDREAQQRALSVYLHEAYVPMLPEALSSGACSLKESHDRLAMSVIMQFDAQGRLTASRIQQSVIRSRKRFDYGEAQALIEAGGTKAGISREVAKTLMLLHGLSRKRIAGRSLAGRLDFDLPEALVERNSAGAPVDILRKPRLASHRLVEEFMVTANEVVAQKLAAGESPALYRVHESPDPESLENLNFQLRTLDPRLKVHSAANVSPAAFTEMLDLAEKQGWGELVSLLVVQSMKRALYSVENLGHFGLASGCYTHFTSPIRRYPDLIVHRLLKRVLGAPAEATAGYSAEELAAICRNCSEREQLIETAERESDSRIEARFMQKHAGGKFAADIITIRPQGFRVRLREFFVEGFVHVSRLDDDYYGLGSEEAALIGASHGKIFRLGEQIEVILAASDPDSGRIDFVPARRSPVPVAGKRNRKGVKRK